METYLMPEEPHPVEPDFDRSENKGLDGEEPSQSAESAEKDLSIRSLADEILSLRQEEVVDEKEETLPVEPAHNTEEVLQIDDEEWDEPGKPAAKSDTEQKDSEGTPQNTLEMAQEVQTPRPGALPVVREPEGPPNRRKLAVAGVALLLVVGYFAGRGGEPAQAEREKQPAQPQRTVAARPESFSSPELGYRARTSPPSAPAPPPAPVMPPPPPQPESPKAKPAPPAVEDGLKSFVVALNEPEGKKPVKENITQEGAKAEQSEPKQVLPKGARIQMTMVEPFRSGIATNITAHVTADVKDAQGKVIIPAGSKASIPFLPYEVNGRCLNDTAAATVFVLPSSAKVSLMGMVKGPDGFPGISGKVRRLDKGNVFTRMGRAMSRVAGRAISSQTGGLEGTAVEDTLNDGVGGPLIYSSGRVVEIKAGTTIFFQVS